MLNTNNNNNNNNNSNSNSNIVIKNAVFVFFFVYFCLHVCYLSLSKKDAALYYSKYTQTHTLCDWLKNGKVGGDVYVILFSHGGGGGAWFNLILNLKYLIESNLFELLQYIMILEKDKKKAKRNELIKWRLTF